MEGTGQGKQQIMRGIGESALGSMTAQEKIRMDAFMARVEAIELHDTPMDKEVSILPVESEDILNNSLNGKGKEKVEVSPILKRGSGCENGPLLNSDTPKAGNSRKDLRPPLNLKAALASQKSNLTKEAQTSGTRSPVKDVTEAMVSVDGRSSLLENGRTVGASGEVRPHNPWLQGWKEKLQTSHRESMGGGKKDQEKNKKQEGYVPISETQKKVFPNSMGSTAKRTFEDTYQTKPRGSLVEIKLLNPCVANYLKSPSCQCN